MRKQIQLNIPNPCHENWEQMKPVEKGRFCDSCKKQVVDFTNMRDEQLVAFFRKRASGSVCGRFKHDQLDRGIEFPKKRIPWLKYFIQFAIPAFLVSCKSSTIGKLKVMSTEQTKITKLENNDLGINNRNYIIEKNLTTVGLILPELISDSVIKSEIECLKPPIKEEFVIDTMPAIDGQVIINVIEYKMINNELETTKILDQTTNLPEVREQDVDTIQDFFMGGIITEACSKTSEKYSESRSIGEKSADGFVTDDSLKADSKDSLFKRIFKKSNDNLFTIYPNPVKSGFSVNIEWKGPKADYYVLELLNLSGQLIFAKEIFIDQRGQVLNIQLPKVTMGSYFLRIQSNRFRNSNAVKLIIE